MLDDAVGLARALAPAFSLNGSLKTRVRPTSKLQVRLSVKLRYLR